MTAGRQISVQPVDSGWAMMIDGKQMQTPRRNALHVPTEALANAIIEEWAGHSHFEARQMPVTSLCFTALDVTAGCREKMAEAMIAYAETDLLLYRSETPELNVRQATVWDPLVEWCEKRYEIRLIATDGVMPVQQSAQALKALKKAVDGCGDFRLTALSVLAQTLSSLILALAVREGELEGCDAFLLSRVDEDYQAEQWGEDSLALGRAREIERDVLATARFMELLAA